MSFPTDRILSRRHFLSFMAISATVASLSPSSVFALNKLSGTPKWPSLKFADRQGLGPDIDAPDVARLCCALHEEKIIPNATIDQSELEAVSKALRMQFAEEGLDWEDEYQVGFTYQHYGKPDDAEYSKHLIQYCKVVTEYANEKLTDLFSPRITWSPLVHENHHNGRIENGFHGLVGRYTYYVLRAVVLNAESDVPCLLQSWPLERAIHYIVAGQSAVPTKGVLYIIPGTTSLVAPFSEMLHLTFHEPSQRYALELAKSINESDAQQQARVAGETVNEAAAIVLATDFMRRLAQPERLSTIAYMAKDLSKTYPYLPNAISYMQQYGVQQAADVYLDNPAVFMTRIKNI